MVITDRLRLVVPGEQLCPPDVGVGRVLRPQDDGRVPDMADVDLAAPDEGYAGGGARRAGQPTRGFRPLF